MNLPDIFRSNRDPVTAIGRRLEPSLAQMPGHESVLQVGGQLAKLAAMTGAREFHFGSFVVQATRLTGRGLEQFSAVLDGGITVSVHCGQRGSFDFRQISISTAPVSMKW